MKHQTVLTRDLDDDQVEIKVTVDFTPHRAIRGARDGRFGPPIEPDEPAHIEIDGVTDENGNDIKLTEDEQNDICTEIMEDRNDRDC